VGEIILLLSYSLVQKDVWVGVQNWKEDRFFDNAALQPFQSIEYQEKIFSDGTPYISEVDFDFELRASWNWEGPCVYLKGLTNFEPLEIAKCDKTKGYICRWNGNIFRL
jgi:hypothetical protein